jgi:hypothetical protein
MSKQKILVALISTALLISSGCVRVPKPAPPKISGFSCRLDKGLWHDVYVTNQSGQRLNEVNITLSIVGENGIVHSEQRYYAVWPNDKTNNISLQMVNSPQNVQKISMTGSSAEGQIAVSWVGY